MTTSKNFNESSVLYIVGTPIGNMSDMSPRAVSILQNCNLILAEDTRHSIHLLKKFNINTKLKSYHMHNELKIAEDIVARLQEEVQTIALISDAGMPVISDPGYILVKRALDHNIKVSVVPGPCAVTAAISVSGIDCSQYSFYGFLATKTKARTEQLIKIMSDHKAGVIYEAPHRLLDCIHDIASIDETRHISVIKEITKKYEKVYYGCVTEILRQLSALDSIKGEYVIVISGFKAVSQSTELEQQIREVIKLFISEDIGAKTTAKIISKLYNQNKNYVYKLITEDF